MQTQMRTQNRIKQWIGRIMPMNGVFTPIILQQSDTECGIVALAILFAYYQFNVPLEQLRDQCGVARDGLKATTLIKTAQCNGFNAEAFNMDLSTLSLLHEPVIAFWNFNHYVVINGFGTNKVFINDPAQGAYSLSMEEFDKAFTGIIIRIIPTKQTPIMRRKAIMQTLIAEWVSGFYFELLFLLCSFLMIACWPLFTSALANIYINQCVIAGHLSWLNTLILLSALASLLLLSSKAILKWHEFKLNAKASLIKSSRIITHLLKMPLLYFSTRQKSEIIANIARVEYVIHTLYSSTNSFIGNMLILIILILYMSRINTQLAIISCCLSVLASISTIVIAKINLTYEKSNINLSGKLYAYTFSWIKNFETIKACGLEDKTLLKTHVKFRDQLKVTDKIASLNAVANLIHKAFNQYISLMILYIGGIAVANGYLTLGGLIAYYSLQGFFCVTVNQMFQSIKDSVSAYASHIRIKEITHKQIDTRFTYPFSAERLTEIDRSEGDILTCQNVSFAYNKLSKLIINQVSLQIKPRQHIGIAGPTGSGKSTMAKLLCALYQPDGGEIYYYRRSITTLSDQQLTRIFAYVSQEVTLFTGTLYDNLVLGNKKANADLVRSAIKIACLEELVNARGLYAAVAEGGQNFSGGEKQRIDIARALIQNAALLVLDEATSALDIDTERKIIDQLRTTNQTIIFIAHRLSTIKHCDQILVMSNGCIQEKGKHQDLMKNKQNYFRMIACA